MGGSGGGGGGGTMGKVLFVFIAVVETGVLGWLPEKHKTNSDFRVKKLLPLSQM